MCIIIIAMLAAGCASAPTKGDKMLAQGVTAQEMAKRWNDGNSLLIEGEKLKKKGQLLLDMHGAETVHMFIEILSKA